MRIGLVIADFEMSYSTSFQHTARIKYGVDFNTSNVNTLGTNLEELRRRMEFNEGKDVHVGFDFNLEHVQKVQRLLHLILDRYKQEFGALPTNRKIYTITQKLRDAEVPDPKEMAKQVLREILSPAAHKKPTKEQQLKDDAEALSKRRALDSIKKGRQSKG
jgi:hypothetical protein